MAYIHQLIFVKHNTLAYREFWQNAKCFQVECSDETDWSFKIGSNPTNKGQGYRNFHGRNLLLPEIS
jgi:hypothetical protein